MLGDTRPLWRDWLADASRVLDVEGLPEDRARGGGRAGRARRGQLADAAGAVRRGSRARLPAAGRGGQRGAAPAASEGVGLAVFTDAPAELARVALAQLGAARRVDVVETGAGALERLGGDITVVRTPRRADRAALDFSAWT